MNSNLKKAAAVSLLLCAALLFGCASRKSAEKKSASDTVSADSDNATKKRELPYFVRNIPNGSFKLLPGKTALVLAGGGAKGAYEIGVYKALLELNIPIDIVTGTSVGALNAAFIVQNMPQRAYDVWTQIDNKLVYEETKKNEKVFEENNDLLLLIKAFRSGDAADSAPLRNMIADNLDIDRFYDSPIDFGLITVKKENLEECRMTKARIPRDKLVDYLMASSSCYPAFEPYIIDGVEYIDGSYRNNVPVDLAQELGAKNFIVVNMDAIGAISRKTIEVCTSQNVLYLSPSMELGKMLKFDSSRAQWNIQLGYLDTMIKFGKITSAKESRIKKWLLEKLLSAEETYSQ